MKGMVNGIVVPPCFTEEGVRINTECYIRMLDDVSLHGAPWHRHIELHRTPAGVPRRFFFGARQPTPQVASVLARPQPTRFSPVASVGNGTGRAAVPVSARTARHDRAHTLRAPLGSFTDAWRACAPQAAISSTTCDGPADVHAFFSF